MTYTYCPCCDMTQWINPSDKFCQNCKEWLSSEEYAEWWETYMLPVVGEESFYYDYV